MIIAVFVSLLLISNLAATKLVAFGPIISDGGAIVFPFIYILSDVLVEVYGYKRMRRAIWISFFVMLFAVITFTLVLFMPAASEYTNQESYTKVFGFFPRIVLASLVAYLIGAFLNAFVFAKLKISTHGKELWFRLISSRVVSEFFDTVIFAFIAFGGILQGRNMAIYILIGWWFKTGVEVVMLPVTYRVIAFLKRKEGVDIYDKKTDFTPLSLKV